MEGKCKAVSKEENSKYATSASENKQRKAARNTCMLALQNLTKAALLGSWETKDV